ncbi:hypothetical protein [Gloeobacter morelensis]|uniref:Copper resistance protein D domain-containing protein n=1 Tax=Gloeobacter morelensis MG652769 TaxID=2781736 RepID=A0ABY3PRJ6_9CYAN|nr:hypothetical protein [Gloeobacter morelensis]UFP96323.1 hypothetical protein ISF26_08980 [Gloeobacter morelensis MG652769]
MPPVEPLIGFFAATHAVAAAVWVGAVFMGSVIDWPVARATVEPHQFPFRFIVGQGHRVFVWVYAGIAILLVSGAALLWLAPPRTPFENTLAALKILALAVMVGNTLYGSLRTWPNLQFATAEEAKFLYRGYMIRAYITCSSGIFAIVLGALGRHLKAVF